MADQRTFDDVSLEDWEKVKAIARNRFGTIFAPDAGPSGTATTATPIGQVIVDYDHDADARQITCTLRKKPFLVLSGQIWTGLAETIERCKQDP
ncbi:MAG: hypothetical protein MUD06_02100 [Rhodospirillales bacterium]|jgi:hypothetical protein|nr:hypothetical protein [Rhodospirillales bacterium]